MRLCVCLCDFMCTACMQLPMMTRRGRQIPWSQDYKRWHVGRVGSLNARLLQMCIVGLETVFTKDRSVQTNTSDFNFLPNVLSLGWLHYRCLPYVRHNKQAEVSGQGGHSIRVWPQFSVHIPFFFIFVLPLVRVPGSRLGRSPVVVSHHVGAGNCILRKHNCSFYYYYYYYYYYY